MGYVVGGGLGVSFRVEIDDVIARMKAMDDKWLRELVVVNREAGVVVNNERRATVPYATGHFAKAGYVRATARNAYVGLKNTGSRSNDYIGVQEFGGRIPRYRGKARAKHFTLIKPHSGEGYYLYPALDRRREVITHHYQTHLTALANKYMA